MRSRILRAPVLLFALTVSVALSAVVPGTGSALPASGLANTFGPQKTLAILVNFQDTPFQFRGEPFTAWDVRMLMATASSFFFENSYGQTWLTGVVDVPWDAADVRGWYTIPVSSPVSPSACDAAVPSIAGWAKLFALSEGVDISAYSRFVYFFPYTDLCPFKGRSMCTGCSPSDTFINGTLNVHADQGLRIVSHELGHSLGLFHSKLLECYICTSNGCSWMVLGDVCDVLEYGDNVDTMGNGRGHYNAFQKERLGWLNDGSSWPSITTVAQDGVYWLEPLETGPGGLGLPKALKIFYSTNPILGGTTWYYVEYRRPLGFDSFLSNPDYATEPSGVFVHLGNDGNGSSFLLDMTPETGSSWVIHDQALGVGRSYTDPYTGMTITLLWADGNAAVNVTFPKP